MKILINAASSKMGGALSYLEHLLPALAARGEDEIHAIVARPALEALEPQGLPGNVRLEAYGGEAQGTAGRLKFDQLAIPRMMRRGGHDLLFSATGFGTFRAGCPQILLLRNAAYFDPAYRAAARAHGKSLLGSTLRRWHAIASTAAADHLVFPTRAMQELCRGSSVIARKPQSIIPYGLNASAVQAEGGTPESVRKLDAWREEGAAVLVCVGDYAVHKNMETLVEALALLRGGGLDARCATTMSRSRTGDAASWDRLMARVRRLGLEDCFISVGYTPASSLGHLYRRADLFVFPSVSESFGHPLVEAMGNGAPVLASDIATHREVCGDAAVYFAPLEPQQLAEKAARLLRDNEMRAVLAGRGRERAGAFSWDRHAAELHALMKNLSGEVPSGASTDGTLPKNSAESPSSWNPPADGEKEGVQLHG